MIPLDDLRVLTARHPEKTAVSCNGVRISFTDLVRRVEAKIRFLACWNDIANLKCAAFISPNRIELVGWLSAFSTLKIPVTGIDFSLPKSSILELIALLKADIILVSSKHMLDIDGLLEIHRSHLIDLDSPTIEKALSISDNAADIDTITSHSNRVPQELRLIGITSGANGHPKLTLRTRSFDARRFEYFTSAYGFSADDRFLVAIPLYHAAGNGWARLFLSLGASLEIVDTLRPTNLASNTISNGITATVLTPPLVDRLLADAGSYHVRPNFSLRWMLVGGKNFTPVAKAHALDQFGPIVNEYGHLQQP